MFLNWKVKEILTFSGRWRYGHYIFTRNTGIPNTVSCHFVPSFITELGCYSSVLSDWHKFAV